MPHLARQLLRRTADQVSSTLYAWLRGEQDRAASRAFGSAFTNAGPGWDVKHPIYLRGPQYVTIGRGFGAGPGLRIEAWDEYLGEKFSPEIVIGDHVGVNWNVHIGAIGRLEIHDYVLIGSNVLITDHAHGTTSSSDLDIPPLHRRLVSKGATVIEQNVWIGEGACILGGVRVGAGAVIGANAVVTRDVEPRTVVGGVPARAIGIAAGDSAGSDAAAAERRYDAGR